MLLLGFILPPSVQSDYEPCTLSNSDPDLFMDNIGRKDFCRFSEDRPQKSDRGFYDQIRESFTNGVLGSTLLNNNGARQSIIDSEGRIYAVGRANDNVDTFFGVERLFPDGSLDTSFNTSGKFTFAFGTGDDIAYAIAFSSDGNPVIVGRTDVADDGEFDYGIIKLTPNGTFDTAFSTDGRLVVDLEGGADFARSVSITPTGSLYVGGYSRPPDYQFSVIKLSSSGVLDTSFHTSGKFRLVFTSESGALRMEVDTSGAVVLAGTVANNFA